MTTEVYGLDWYNGDELSSAYTEVADAQLDVINYSLERHLEEIMNDRFTIGLTEASADMLALNVVSIVDDWYIDDTVNIVSISLFDKFTP